MSSFFTFFRMEVLTAAVALAACALCRTLSTETTDRCAILGQFCPTRDVGKALGRQLSSATRIYRPGTLEFNQSTARWSTLDAPHITITVEPATEDDVVKIVRYANERNIPFLAVNGGHGAITTVGKMEYGIQIWMRQLRAISIAKDGRSATFGGGVLSKNVTDTLWAAGKQTGKVSTEGTTEIIILTGDSYGRV